MSTDKKTIDWYNAHAEEYEQHLLAPETSLYHAYYEKPAMYGLLPDLKGKEVISLGCGTGKDSKYLFDQGISSDDDPSIIDTVDVLRKAYPEAKVHEFEGKGHFTENDLGSTEFPEPLDLIK